MIAAHNTRFDYLQGTIKEVNGNYDSYNVEFDIGGIRRGIKEEFLEDCKKEEICPKNDATFENNIPEVICPKCGGNNCGCEKCNICNSDPCNC